MVVDDKLRQRCSRAAGAEMRASKAHETAYGPAIFDELHARLIVHVKRRVVPPLSTTQQTTLFFHPSSTRLLSSLRFLLVRYFREMQRLNLVRKLNLF
jgi:hypothetical protein